MDQPTQATGQSGHAGQTVAREGTRQAAIRYFQSGLPQEAFVKTLDALWTQAQGIFGEDAAQVICDAIHSDDPAMYLEKYMPSFATAGA